jgi:hypothetical protein
MPPYVPQVWVDNTTPVDASHMQHVEDGLVVADANASAALGNNVRSIDRLLTNAEIRAMHTTPIVLIPGVAGEIHFPFAGGLLANPGSIAFANVANFMHVGPKPGAYYDFSQSAWHTLGFFNPVQPPSSLRPSVVNGTDLLAWLDSAITVGDGTIRLTFDYMTVKVP